MKPYALLALAIVFTTIPLHAQETAESFALRGDSLARAESYKDALSAYDRAIALDGARPKYYVVRAKILIALEEVDRGQKDISRALALDSNCSGCYVVQSFVAANQGKVSEAMALVNRAILIDRDNVDGYLLRGQIRQAKGMGADALVDYNNAALRDPKNTRVMLAKAKYYLEQGDRITALDIVSEVFVTDSNNVEAYYLRTRLNADLQKWEQALADIDRCIVLQPTSSQFHDVKGTVYSHMQRFAEAIAEYDQAIELHSESYQTYMNRGMARYQMEDMDGACADGRRAVALAGSKISEDPELQRMQRQLGTLCDRSNVAYFYQRGIAEYNKKEFDASVATYNEGLKKFTKNPMLIYFRANAYLAAGKYKEAVRDYDSSLANVTLLSQRMMEEGGGNDDEMANLEAAKRSISIAVLADRGNAKSSMGDYEGALADYNRAIILAADQNKGHEVANLYYGRGLMELAVGNNDGAQRDLERSIAIDPNNPHAHINRAISIMNRVGSQPIVIRTITFSQQQTGGFNQSVTIPLPSRAEKSPEVDEAIVSCTKAISIDPSLGRAYAMRGYARLAKGDNDGCADLHRAFGLGEEEVVGDMLRMCR